MKFRVFCDFSMVIEASSQKEALEKVKTEFVGLIPTHAESISAPTRLKILHVGDCRSASGRHILTKEQKKEIKDFYWGQNGEEDMKYERENEKCAQCGFPVFSDRIKKTADALGADKIIPPQAVLDGKTYYFCSEACRRRYVGAGWGLKL